MQENPQSADNQPMSRRTLIKAIALAGGATFIPSHIPSQWTSPVVEVGTLPAHAQGSPPSVSPTNTVTPAPTATNVPAVTFTISNLSRTLITLNDCRGGNGSVGSIYEIQFDYLNTAGDVQTGATVSHTSRFIPSNRESSFDTQNISISGDGSSGTITYSICTGFGSDTAVTTVISLTDVSGRQSNQLSITQDRPVGATESGTAYEIP